MRHIMAAMLLLGLSLGVAACVGPGGDGTTKNHPVASP